jgi:hypothetical protein
VSELLHPAIQDLERRLQDVPGWSPIDELYTLYTLACTTAHLPGDFLEIGSWCGRSTLTLGRAAQRIGMTNIRCIDLFPSGDDWKRNADGSYSFRVTLDGVTYGGYEDQTVWAEPYARDIAPLYRRPGGVFGIFQETLRANGLEHLVQVYRGNSALFARRIHPDFRCKLGFVDGDHSYDAVVQDIEVIDRHLVPGGWICFDDAHSHYRGVDRAIEDRILRNPAYELGQQMTRKLFVARKRMVG